MSRPEPDDPTPPRGLQRPVRGAPTPPSGSPTRRHGDVHPRIARRRAATASPAAPTRARRRLVEIARVLAGGLVALALAVIVGPWVLGGPGAGGAIVVGHVAGAVVALLATAIAAHHRTPTLPAVLAASVVPVDVLVVLGSYWWA